MKKLPGISILLICSLCLFTCSKDKDDNLSVVRGSFTVEGNSYELHKGDIGFWGSEGDSVYYYGIILYSSGIYFENNHGYMGEGSSVMFFIANSVHSIPEMKSFPIAYDVDVQADQAFDVQLFPGIDDDLTTMDYYFCTSGTVTFNTEDNISTVIIEAKTNKLDHKTDEVLNEDVAVSLKYTGEI